MTPNSANDRIFLTHILSCVARIREYTGNNREVFFNSSLVQDASIRNLQILAESTQQLSETLKKTRKDIPWREISGFRNVIAHNYLGVDLNVVWSVIELDLDPLNEAADEMLRTLDFKSQDSL